MKSNTLLSHRKEEPENSVLYVVGTPIGNLNDFSLRAINILKKVSLIACEDTRQTKKLLHRFEINNFLISFNKHNSFKKIPSIINSLKGGKSIALVSDAGMPSICDPGEDLISEVKANGIQVICIPGPCAAIAALVSSGLPSSKFIFEGFLPRKKVDREEILLNICNSQKSTILYESPHRLKKLLNDLKEFCGSTREIHVARELTKKYEEHISNDIETIIQFFEDREILGEFTIVVKGLKKKLPRNIDEVAIKKDLKNLLDAGISLSSAAKYLAKKEKLSKNIIYNLY
tara:strand:+ start:73 stop:936 length:864 start_codon:yes stop_codon:yes gene_type:complete